MYHVVALQVFFSQNFSQVYVDLSATFLDFQYSSRSSYLVNLTTPQNLPALCCNFTRMFFTWNSWNTSIFLNFQTSPRSGCMLNIITPSELHVSSYNFTRRVSTFKSLSGWGVPVSQMPIFNSGKALPRLFCLWWGGWLV